MLLLLLALLIYQQCNVWLAPVSPVSIAHFSFFTCKKMNTNILARLPCFCVQLDDLDFVCYLSVLIITVSVTWLSLDSPHSQLCCDPVEPGWQIFKFASLAPSWMCIVYIPESGVVESRGPCTAGLSQAKLDHQIFNTSPSCILSSNILAPKKENWLRLMPSTWEPFVF